MKNVLYDLYDGKIIPWERRSPYNPERNELIRKIEKEEQYFVAKMSLDDCQRFQAYINMLGQVSGIEETEVFAYGFRLGAAIMNAVLDDEEPPRPPIHED